MTLEPDAQYKIIKEQDEVYYLANSNPIKHDGSRGMTNYDHTGQIGANELKENREVGPKMIVNTLSQMLDVI